MSKSYRVYDVDIDLSTAQKAAARVRNMLLQLRADHDLSAFEYTRHARIAPGEISHSHPILTLNTLAALLSAYLHEQMRWYVTWYSCVRTPDWDAVRVALPNRYAVIPIAFPEGAHDARSSYLHLIINWLETDATARFLHGLTPFTLRRR